MKTYTSFKQSKKLAEILSLQSADMHYERVYFEGKQSDWFVRLGKPIKSDDIIPCWSLAALLEYLRKLDLFPEIKDGGDYILMDITFYYENEVMGKVINPVHFIRAEGKNILDACYEFILKLNEQKLL